MVMEGYITEWSKHKKQWDKREQIKPRLKYTNVCLNSAEKFGTRDKVIK